MSVLRMNIVLVASPAPHMLRDFNAAVMLPSPWSRHASIPAKVARALPDSFRKRGLERYGAA